MQVAITFGRMKGFLYPIQLSRPVVFHYTFDQWNQPGLWEKETLITHIPPFFVICSNSYTRIWDWCSPAYASMTLQVIEGIWHDISRNPTRTMSSMKVSTIRDVTHKLCVYDLAASFNRRPLSRAATVIAVMTKATSPSYLAGRNAAVNVIRQPELVQFQTNIAEALYHPLKRHRDSSEYVFSDHFSNMVNTHRKHVKCFICKQEIIWQELTSASPSTVSPNIDEWRAIDCWDFTTWRQGSTQAIKVQLQSIHLNGHQLD